MIYTRSGREVKILSEDSGWLTVLTEDGKKREWYISEFKADEGSKEIQEAIQKTKEGL